MGSRGLVDFLSQKDSYDQNWMHGISFGSVILVNAETDMSAFLSGINSIASKVENITIYGDSNDQALFWAELFNHPQCGCWQRNNESSLGRGILRLESSNNLPSPPCYYYQGVLDIINATSVSSNVHELRHSYFSLSREVIEDIRELIVTRRRAEHRKSRLTRRYDSNIFDFLLAPPHMHT